MNYQAQPYYPVDNPEYYNQTSANQLTPITPKTALTNQSSTTVPSTEDIVSITPTAINNIPSTDGIIIPMDQSNYNTLLTQMYPQYNHTNTYTNDNNPYSTHNYYAQTQTQTQTPINMYNTYDNNAYLYNNLEQSENVTQSQYDPKLMKLPHLRKHYLYINQINTKKTPTDYNNDGRTANIQNLNANVNTNLNANNRRNYRNNNNNNNNNNKMRGYDKKKGDLFKTELCINWIEKGHCSYGKKCKFAHGSNDIRTNTIWRIENYKSQPCCDPARPDSRLCLFGKRCNYAHPGEPLRRSHNSIYLDKDYHEKILKDYGKETPYPFGIYL